MAVSIPIVPAAEAAPAQVRDIQHYMRPGLLQLTSLPPLALYVHLPWCLKKCPYCDFNSHEWREVDGAGNAGTALPEARYLDALMADLEAALPLVWGRSVHSIFIGGGTPSLFSPQSIDRQSFNDRHLKALGRVHDRAQALAAVQEAASAFDTFNLDIMYALPGQTLPELEQDMATALALAPPHISIYHLTIEPNTYFAKFPPAIPPDDDAYAMLDRITEMTGQAGLARYEISAYHNTNYWQFGDYLGLGAGAHSKLSFAHRVVRQTRFRDPRLYMDNALAGRALAQDEDVRRADLPFEYMLNALRLREGFALQDFVERTGLPVTAIAKALDEAERKGLITRDMARVRPTERGFDFLNDLQALFLAD
ncbi:MAG: YggW family oxidoreductase [Acidovorax sp. 17-64-282]|nr:MAG: YggW family oxidoreductase [Acidovorax sp. 17-64-282]